MNCPECGHENRESAKLCGACWFALAAMRSCPACGTENPPGQRFCDECGEAIAAPAPAVAAPRSPRAYTPRHLADRILQSRSALEGERKQVTVLFANVNFSVADNEAEVKQMPNAQLSVIHSMWGHVVCLPGKSPPDDAFIDAEVRKLLAYPA